jgi:hypothetical protein
MHLSKVLAALLSLVASSAAFADGVNVSGQGQQTQGSGPANPANPAQNAAPSYPGDQPQKQGTDSSSQVHNVDPKDLEGKTHKQSENTN